MQAQDYTTRTIDITHDDEDESWAINSITNASTTEPPSSTTTIIHRAPKMVKDNQQDYHNYYVPNVVSIGPYHFGNPKLEYIEQLKPVYTMKLVAHDEQTLRSLYRNLSEPSLVQQLKNSYEDNIDFTNMFCHKVFVKMMMLDACFILYYIQYIFGENLENCQELKRNQIAFIYQDLFLLENQIPFVVLKEVMKLIDYINFCKIEPFVCDNVLASSRPKRSWFRSLFCARNHQTQRYVEEDSRLDFYDVNPDHLIGLLHRSLTREVTTSGLSRSSQMVNHHCTYRNVNELMNLGVHFKPSSTMSLAHIEFCKGFKWWFSATVKLPPITINDSTKALLLNLIAYEMCSRDAARDAWVTSYVCMLDQLIDRAEDVTGLRKAGVLENCLGSDEEVAALFNEIGTDLVPNSNAYLDAKNSIQMHFESPVNKYFWQLKQEYFKSPWSIFAFLGAITVIALNIVQTCFTVWSKHPCDDLCTMLKTNHHL